MNVLNRPAARGCPVRVNLVRIGQGKTRTVFAVLPAGFVFKPQQSNCLALCTHWGMNPHFAGPRFWDCFASPRNSRLEQSIHWDRLRFWVLPVWRWPKGRTSHLGRHNRMDRGRRCDGVRVWLAWACQLPFRVVLRPPSSRLMRQLMSQQKQPTLQQPGWRRLNFSKKQPA